ncbi:hypothetical protein RUM44_011383 [Polyplax serrata]|uniref:Uncharacterized protein n=1 Tax=Polyplax serrata TaxID=468196 RepID=A0ABR1AQ51_POLSC
MVPNGKIASVTRRPTTQSRHCPSAKTEKAHGVLALENKNWLIYFHYTRYEFGICNILIKEELKKSNGMNEYVNYIQGIILRHEGKIQESLEYFQKCHILNPKSIEIIKQVSRSLSLLGRQKLSLEALTEATNISNSLDGSICHNLGLCYYNLGDLVKGKEYL